MSFRVPKQLTALKQNLTNNTFVHRIDEVLDIHNKNSTLYPDFDDASSRLVNVITDYNTELNKNPGERQRSVMLLALTLPHDIIYEFIKEIANDSIDKLEERIDMFKLLTYELEEIKFLLHDISRESGTHDDISFSMLSVYQQAFITSRDVLNRMEKLSEAVS